MRTNNTPDLQVIAADTHDIRSGGDDLQAGHGSKHRRQGRLSVGEQDRLRRLIEGPVAAMTAGYLTIDLDQGLDRDPNFELAIHTTRDKILEPHMRLSSLREHLVSCLPQDASPIITLLLLEAVARQLGREWLQDQASIVDVSIASARLQNCIQAIALEESAKIQSRNAHFVLICLPEGEKHSLMPYLTGALFAASGWHHEVCTYESDARADLHDAASRADLICIGWCDSQLKSNLKRLISDVRLHSAPKRPPIIAGGAAALDTVDFLVGMGIDSICDSAYSALKVSENFKNLEKVLPISSPFFNAPGSIIRR
ncbi:hypothetical protein E1180_16375, partial [Roseibium denhamense]